MSDTSVQRCGWAKTELMIDYHDKEWGVPLHDDRALFEFLILEGMQAGLSWEIIIRKRESYRTAFSQFDPRAISRYDGRKIKRLLANPGIIRNRLKVSAAIQNARTFLAVQKEFGSFDAFVWRFVGGYPRLNRRRSLSEIPSRTPHSDAMSKELLNRGFKFVGSTICYAFMQAVGMVNDHLMTCFRWQEVEKVRDKSLRV
ncbi:MAG: DNA-3-methyladenine glycosylase I [Candidatus Binatia bacterium]